MRWTSIISLFLVIAALALRVQCANTTFTPTLPPTPTESALCNLTHCNVTTVNCRAAVCSEAPCVRAFRPVTLIRRGPPGRRPDADSTPDLNCLIAGVRRWRGKPRRPRPSQCHGRGSSTAYRLAGQPPATGQLDRCSVQAAARSTVCPASTGADQMTACCTGPVRCGAVPPRREQLIGLSLLVCLFIIVVCYKLLALRLILI